MTDELGIRLKNPPHVGGFIRHEIVGAIPLSVTDAAKALALSGYVDQASARSAETLRLAVQVGHPPSFACVLYTDLVIHVARREWEVVRDHAENHG